MTFDANDVVRRLGARLKMRHLVLLLQIQQHGSLTRVAEHMASSQPAVTNALSELESMFGTPLFERSSRGMRPTALGAVVLERAKAMIRISTTSPARWRPSPPGMGPTCTSA